MVPVPDCINSGRLLDAGWARLETPSGRIELISIAVRYCIRPDRVGSVLFGSVRVGSGRVRARFSPRLPQIRPESVGCDSLGSGRAQADCTFRILHQFGFRPGSVPDCIKSGRVETEAGNSVGSGPLQSETASGRFRSRTT